MTPAERVHNLMKEEMFLEWARGRASNEDLGIFLSEVLRMAIAEEREACAQVADAHSEVCPPGVVDTGIMWRGVAARAIAATIRARGK